METREIIEVFTSLKLPFKEVRLTGGCTAIEPWNQIQADMFGKDVSTLREPQASLLGAAVLAWCGIGAFRSVGRAARCMVRIRKTYRPRPAHAARYEKLYRDYCKVRRGLARSGVFGKTAGRT